MTAPMGANISSYAAQAGCNNAAQVQNANCSGNLSTDQAGAIGGGPGPTQQAPLLATI